MPQIPVQYPGMMPKHIIRQPTRSADTPWSRPDEATQFKPDTMNYSGTILLPGKRHRFNVVAIVLNVFLPWLLFCVVYAGMSLAYHYAHPVSVWGLPLFGIICSLLLLYAGASQRIRGRDPSWYHFAAMACGFGTICATAFGNANFQYNMKPYLDISYLRTVASVNPSSVVGQQMMDVGVANFADGAGINTRMSMSFKSDDTYCVAPIVNDGEPTKVYDFWAVGINCCSDVAADFRCGEWQSPQARSGLRLMRMEQRPYFRLAVQQAEAAFGIQAPHPVFFTWLSDPENEINRWREDVIKTYIQGIVLYFVFNLFCVFCAMIGFSKIGYLEKLGFQRW